MIELDEAGIAKLQPAKPYQCTSEMIHRAHYSTSSQPDVHFAVNGLLEKSDQHVNIMGFDAELKQNHFKTTDWFFCWSSCSSELQPLSLTSCVHSRQDFSRLLTFATLHNLFLGPAEEEFIQLKFWPQLSSGSNPHTDNSPNFKYNIGLFIQNE